MFKLRYLKYWLLLPLLVLLQILVTDLSVIGECWSYGSFDGRHFAALGNLLQPVVFLLFFVILSHKSARTRIVELSHRGLNKKIMSWCLAVFLIVVTVAPAIYLADSKFHRVERRMAQPFLAELALERCIERGVDIQQWGSAIK